ncbi:MAG: GspE/PulE family protein [Candidatus Peribacteraceae bacterium]|nr:GspE/PulE family protein [Candidatus Peribacteraceae bacterium]MDD5742968.1 GspE/PulE family protein [Candidatus Peribacteraceae bacterium]
MAPNQWEQMDGKTLLDTLEQQCVAKGISDLHCSPEKEFVRFEVRLHGVLELLAHIVPAVYVDFLRHVKFASRLKMNITNIPQDGQLVFAVVEKDQSGHDQSRTVNIRVATIPSRFGEAITLRFLDPKRGIVNLKELGFPDTMSGTLADMMKVANGLFLITGPTGSGKTTTLYALLKTLIGTHRHIITLEDPIEYEIGGIVQSQMDASHDYTFATGLRSILRHDPNVILVGEIRDLETAQTAIDASLTGHLVLSTLHTNSAIEAIPRLLSMGVSPYTFAPALRGVMAQRLVRTLTKELQKEGAKVDPADSASYGGRTVIAELLQATPEIQNLILNNESATVIEQQARKQGYISMREMGDQLVKERMTVQSEVDRVTR